MIPDIYQWDCFLLLELCWWEMIGIFFGGQGLRTARALNSFVNSAVTDASTSFFAAVTPA